MGMEMLSHNFDNAVPEAVLRSFRKGFLSEMEYQQLKQTSNISEFKLVMEDTDYGSDLFLAQEGQEFEVQALRMTMKEKLMNEFQFLISNSTYPLNQFLTMMLHRYQIDNVVFVIEGLKSQRSIEDLMRTADPLGRFPELKNIQPIDGDDYASLYQSVLVDLPVGNYFRKFLNEVTSGAASDENVQVDTKFISEAMQDYSLQQIQLRVKKIWLHEFYDFCSKELADVSQRMMTDLLKFESDLMTIQIIENSRSYTGLVDARGDSERKKYISKVGYLYPDKSEALNGAADFKALVNALEATPYHAMMSKVVVAENDKHEAESQGATIDEVMLKESSRRFSEAFEDGFHFGCFYSYLKLKEQEIKNVTWLAELVTMQVSRNLPGWNKYVTPFMYHAEELRD